MKISKDLPNFEKESAIFLVAGKHSVVLYFAYNGRIEAIEDFKVLHPTYSDHEGFAQVSGHGQVYRHNYLNELQEDATIEEFLRQIRDQLKRHIGFLKPKTYYVFTPKFLQNSIIETFPKKEQTKVSHKFLGNYVKSHPFELLRMIKETDEKILGQKVPLKEEARKILRSD